MKSTYLSIVYTLLCLFLFSTCKKEKEEIKHTSVINLANVLTGDKSIQLADICRDIQLIQLETSEDILVKDIFKILLTDKNILVVHGQQCSLFNLNGKYIRDIGAKGEGPEEYIYRDNVSVENDIVLITDVQGKKIITYDINNQYLNSIRIPNDVREAAVINNHLFAGYHPNLNGSEAYKIKLFDTNGHILDSIPYPTKYENPAGVVTVYYNETIMYKYGENLHLKELFNDTIFALTANSEVFPRYILDLGQYAPQEVRRYSLTSPRENALEGKKRIISLIESELLLFIGVSGIDKDRHILYNKQTDETENIALKYGEKEKKLFDVDYFNPRFISEDKKTLIGYEASEDIDNDNNPVIVLAKLKE